MGPIAIRRHLARCRRHLATIVVLTAIGSAIALHHTGVALGDPHHGMDVTAVVEMCLGAFTAVGAAVVAVAIGLIALGRWRPPLIIGPRTADSASPRLVGRARAGPDLLEVLCVRRR